MSNTFLDNTVLMSKKMKKYSFDFYCLLFFLLAFIGWVWETALYFFTEHTFINRGIYKGPYLPIYGVGGILIYICFYRWKKRPLRVFLGSLILCSLIEYATSWFLELKWGVRWWDYSGHFLNVNGRICLLGASAFGICGTVLLCVLAPFYEKVFLRIPYKLRIGLMVFFLFVFVADAARAAVFPNMGKGISY